MLSIPVLSSPLTTSIEIRNSLTFWSSDAQVPVRIDHSLLTRFASTSFQPPGSAGLGLTQCASSPVGLLSRMMKLTATPSNERI